MRWLGSETVKSNNLVSGKSTSPHEQVASTHTFTRIAQYHRYYRYQLVFFILEHVRRRLSVSCSISSHHVGWCQIWSVLNWLILYWLRHNDAVCRQRNFAILLSNVGKCVWARSGWYLGVYDIPYPFCMYAASMFARPIQNVLIEWMFACILPEWQITYSRSIH